MFCQKCHVETTKVRWFLYKQLWLCPRCSPSIPAKQLGIFKFGRAIGIEMGDSSHPSWGSVGEEYWHYRLGPYRTFEEYARR